MQTFAQRPRSQAAVIWVDGWHALIAHTDQGRATVTEVDRVAEPEHDYLLRVAQEADDCERVMILGPETTRVAFEREYATLYARGNRFVDAETAALTTERELIERLHVLEPDQRRS